MNKLNILIGIGFMLVAALVYTLPDKEEDITGLVPALSGFVIAFVGLRGLRGEIAPAGVTFANMMGCFLLILYSILRLIPQSVADRMEVDVFCNLAIIGYAMLFVFVAKQSLMDTIQA